MNKFTIFIKKGGGKIRRFYLRCSTEVKRKLNGFGV